MNTESGVPALVRDCGEIRRNFMFSRSKLKILFNTFLTFCEKTMAASDVLISGMELKRMIAEDILRSEQMIRSYSLRMGIKWRHYPIRSVTLRTTTTSLSLPMPTMMPIPIHLQWRCRLTFSSSINTTESDHRWIRNLFSIRNPMHSLSTIQTANHCPHWGRCSEFRRNVIGRWMPPKNASKQYSINTNHWRYYERWKCSRNFLGTFNLIHDRNLKWHFSCFRTLSFSRFLRHSC